MGVHPQLAEILARRAAANLPAYSAGSAADARRAFAEAQAQLPRDRGAKIHKQWDESATLRLYQGGAGPSPGAIVYLHGGGWVFGTLDAFDPICRELAASSSLDVVSVDYRLAPEHPFPAALEDAYGALLHVAARRNGPLVVMGDSAGGNLAALAAIAARDRGGPRLALQVLVYPITDFDFGRPSYEAFGNGKFLLSTADMEWYWRNFAPDEALRLNAAPLRAADLSGLPRTIIVAAGCDPLRDEALAYARRLEGSGVPTRLELAPDMTHGFFTMIDVFPPANAAARRIGAEIQDAVSA